MNWFFRIAVLAMVSVGVQVAHAEQVDLLAPVAQALEGALQARAPKTDEDKVQRQSATSTCNNSLYITNANGAVASRQTNGCAAYGNQKYPRDMVRAAIRDLNWRLVFIAGGFDIVLTDTTFTNVPGGAMYVMVHYDASNMSSEATFFNERVY